jgi:ribose/xylose/arabinose/galactoside ABC-type transport system permease subunit
MTAADAALKSRGGPSFGALGNAKVDRPLVRLMFRPEFPALIFLFVLIAFFASIAQGFFTAANLQQILVQTSIVGIMALGLNQVVLAGEIDVSVGSNLAVCAWAAGTVAVSEGGLALPTAVALGLGAFVGLINGLLVVAARIPSIIVTLATLYGLQGFEEVFNSVGIAGIPSSSRGFGAGTVLGLNVDVVVLLATFAVVSTVMRHTPWGREAAAVGGNRRAALLAGLPTNSIRLASFVLTGLCVGLAALVYIGQVDAVQASAGSDLVLSVVASVVIGGTSITGGRGSTFAALVGAVLMGTMLNGMSLLGIVERWQDVFTGAVVLLAVGSDVVRQRIVGRLTAP